MALRARMRWVPGLVCLLSPAWAHAAQAADGRLDATFGRGGRVTTKIGTLDQVGGLALAPGGKIVVAGTASTSPAGTPEIVIARYDRDGSPDTSFSKDGIQTTRLGESASANAVALQSNGRIVVLGSSSTGPILVRYLTDGSLDRSFGAGGIRTAAGGPDSDIAIQRDGRIVTAGSVNEDFAVARFNVDGSPDAGFGAAGLRTTDIAGGSDMATSVALQADGRIVAAGMANVGGGSGRGFGPLDLAVARYTSDGSTDPSFSGDGRLTVGRTGVDEYANDVAIQADGAIVAAGEVGSGAFLLARFRPDGALDPAFAGGGLRTTEVSRAEDGARGVALAPGGLIVAAGQADGDFALARYDAGGLLDASFADRGTQTTAMSGGYDAAAGVVVGPGCRIVVAGEARGRFALARYVSRCQRGAGASAGTLVDDGTPRTRLVAPRVQRLGRFISIRVSCAQDPCRVIAGGSVRVAAGGGARPVRFTLRETARTIRRRRSSATVRVALTRAARRAIGAALRQRRRSTVLLRVTISQPDAAQRTLRRSIRLTR